jgi:hypothetical protein
LTVRGDVRFGDGVKLVGRVNLVNASGQQKIVEDGTVLEGSVEL